MKKAIVTGASGFIGYYLVQELLSNGYEVLAVVHSERGVDTIQNLHHQNVQAIICNIPDFTRLYQVAHGPYDVFFHMAWNGVSGANSQDFSIQLNNIQGAVQAIQTAKELKCKRFLGAGSLHEIECMREMEQSKPAFNWGISYKTAKLAAHYYAKLEASRCKIDFLWPRLTNTYGAGEQSARLINSIIRKLIKGESPVLTAGNQLYNFIYITDTARAYRMIAEKGTSFANYTIGSENVRPLKEYLLKVNEIVNPDVSMSFGQYPFQGICLDKEDLYSENLFSDIGFSTNVSFEKGIRLTFDYCKRL